MRLLTGPSSFAPADADELTDDDLRTLYAAPRTPWLRVNMVSTIDGAATGEGGKTGTINNAADKRVFHLLRAMADAIVVGAGTARAEGYRPTRCPLVLVTRSASLPPRLEGAPEGSVLVATCASSPGLAAARSELGDDGVLVVGEDTVDLAALKAALAERGLVDVLSEGGPHLLRDLLAAGVADEVCATTVPRLIAGDHLRMTAGPAIDSPAVLHTLVEEDGTLLARWLTDR